MTALLGGCGGTGSSDVTLKLVATDYGDSAADSSKKYWDQLVKDYESRHPGVKIEVSVYSPDDVDRKVKEMADAGEPPDLAQLGGYADYATKGLLYKADDVLSIPVQADFVAQLADAGQSRHVQYGIPFAASTRVLFYNKTLFAKANLNPPKTWEQLAAAARALKARGVKYPYALPLGPEDAQAETLQWLLSGGTGYTDDIGTYTIAATQNVQTFTWLKEELVGKGLTGPVAPGKLNRADAVAAFTDGRVGMIDGQPALMRQAKQKGVRFGMVPMPGRNDTARATMGDTDWMIAFKKNGHRAEIGGFLDFVYGKKNMVDFARAYDRLPVTGSASEAMASAHRDKDLRPFLKGLPQARLYPLGKTSWAQVGADIRRKIGQAVAPNGNPSDVLEQLQATAAEAESTRG